MIQKLTLFALTTGLLPSLSAVATLATLVAAPTTLIYGVFFWNVSKLYSNSLFATLNARDMIRERTPVRSDGTSLGRHVDHDSPERTGHQPADLSPAIILTKKYISPVSMMAKQVYPPNCA